MLSSQSIWSLAAVAGLSAVHLASPLKIDHQSRLYRNWLSFCAGCMLSFVFLELLPAMADSAEMARAWTESAGIAVEHPFFTAALGAMVLLYLASHFLDGTTSGPRYVTNFWLNVSTFAVFNFMTGYLLEFHHEAPGHLALHFAALALHMFLVDVSFREGFHDLYVRSGRWVLSAALFMGWGVGHFTELPAMLPVVITAGLAGSALFNTLRSEVPEAANSVPLALTTGVVVFALLV